jgi:MYXO-CTERM domain-containing protein
LGIHAQKDARLHKGYIMMRIATWLAGIIAIGSAVIAQPAQAVSIGTLSEGSHFSDVITSTGPTYSRDYTFHLNSSVDGMTILATGLGQTSPAFGVTSINLSLFDAASTLISNAVGATAATMDSFHQSGVALVAGDYLLSVFGNVVSGKEAFVSVSIAANSIGNAPLPPAILMGLTGLGALGGLALYRRRHLRHSHLDCTSA